MCVVLHGSQAGGGLVDAVSQALSTLVWESGFLIVLGLVK